MCCDTVEFYKSIYVFTYQIPSFEDWITQHHQQQQQQQLAKKQHQPQQQQ